MKEVETVTNVKETKLQYLASQNNTQDIELFKKKKNQERSGIQILGSIMGSTLSHHHMKTIQECNKV